MFFICDVVLTEKFEGLGRASMSVHDNKRKTLAFMAIFFKKEMHFS